MVRHVICEHGARKLAYIDGRKEYSDAAKEHRHTKDVLERKKGSHLIPTGFQRGLQCGSLGTYVVSELDRMHRIPRSDHLCK